MIGGEIGVIGAAPAEAGEDRRRISERRLDGLLAEETTWRGVDFADCEITDTSFAGGRFENCTFERCAFENTNLSRVTLAGNEFVDCTFQDLQIAEPVWMDCRFERCVFQRLSLTDAAVRDLSFTDGEWEEIGWLDGLMVDVALCGTQMRQVTYLQTHAPNSRFERLSMFKVWGMGKGFPGSVFEEVEAKTCGFVSAFHFTESRFERTRFAETGFTGAVFKDAFLAPGCQFTTCDLGGAMFENTQLAGVRFVQCNMVTSRWAGVDASEAWFFGALLRGVDFNDTELGRAVFMDADVEGTKFLPDKTIGADFRGTVRGME